MIGGFLMKRIFLSMVFVLVFILSGCGEHHIEGIVIDVQDAYLLIAQNITTDQYDDIRHKSPTDIQNDDVAGVGLHLGLIDISYKQTANFSAGDYVHVWLSGDIMESYPSRATAKKVKLAD